VPSAPRTLVVVPTYDEAANIENLLDRVRAASPGIHVLVVDDGSPDGTARLVRRYASGTDGVFLLERSAKAGLGAAYRAGFRWALERDYEAVIQMDADLSHPAERVPALLDALRTADVAVGSRYVPGGRVVDWAWSRRVISRAGNLYVRLVLGLPVRDATAGFKAFRREALVGIGATDATSEGYCFQIENTWRAVRCGLDVVEIPITFVERAEGTSKMSGSIVGEALRRVLVWRWHELTGAASPRPSEARGDRAAA
jgi:dolichol-phosphate mannosyltransferase